MPYQRVSSRKYYGLPVRVMGMRGLGDDGSTVDLSDYFSSISPDTTPVDTSILNPPPIYGPTLEQLTGGQAGGGAPLSSAVINAATGGTSSSGLSPAELSVISQGLKTTGQLVQTALTPAGGYTQTTPYSFVSSRVPGAVPAASTSVSASLGGMSGTAILLIGGVVVLVGVMAMNKSKR
jgi:hypothetical protein